MFDYEKKKLVRKGKRKDKQMMNKVDFMCCFVKIQEKDEDAETKLNIGKCTCFSLFSLRILVHITTLSFGLFSSSQILDVATFLLDVLKSVI